jgi:hypothetical protein
MPFIADRVLDFGLSVLNTEANRLDICNTEPTTYAQATGAASLGSKTALIVGAPEAASPDGRRVVVAAFSDGVVATTGTATHYAITDTVNSRLLVAAPLDAPQVVTDGNSFSLPAIPVRIPGAV